MPSFSFLRGKFFGNTVGIAAGYAAGGATQRVLDPVLQPVANEAWTKNPVVPPDAYGLALAVAQGQVDPKQAASWAAQQGLGAKQFQALVDAANTGPGLGQAYEAWRRGFLTDAEFQTALNRTGLEPQWWDALKQLKDRLLDPAEVAKAIHRGIMKGDGLLIASPPSTPGKVPAVPPSDLDPIAEAAGAGIDAERLRIMVGNAGLPLGLHEMLSLLNRGAMEASDVQRGIAESNLRNEYQDVALLLARQLLTAHEYVEAQIRGYITEDERRSGTRLHGMEDADSDLLFLNAGRPLNVHQITTGLARGGTFHPEPNEITDPYLAAVHESNVKPAYYDLAVANKYTLPGYFVIKAMLTAGSITEAEAAQLFKEEGWPPDLADKAATALAPTTGGATDPTVKSQVTALLTATRKAYVANGITHDQAAQALAVAGLDAATQAEVFKVWDEMVTVEDAIPPPRPTAPASLIAEAEAAGYTVTPPTPPDPDAVLKLRQDGYTVTKG